MPTISNGEGGLSVRNKLNTIIEQVEGTTPITAADIDGGTIDGTVIGGATPAAGTFTDVGADALDLAAIAETKAVTAVDVFVYDTSKDSDGGAWRKRTQHTSWYNETLNTATRGARREFPAVAVIVAEADKVTIYDGDDPALPMWMVFESSEGTNAAQVIFRTGASAAHRSLAAINGVLTAGMTQTANYAGGLRYVRFIADDAYYYDETSAATDGKFNGNIARRNEVLGFSKPSNWTPIVNRRCNDVAITVLPDAPIDPATGLPVPTIACLVGETEVLMADGSTKRLDQVQPGETVKTLEGEHKVLNWWDQGIKDVIELEFDGGQKLICTTDHKIRTTDGWVEAGDLTEDHEVIAA